MATHRKMIRLLLTFGLILQECDSDVKCMNDNGAEVDWYILYKLPTAKSDGLSYLYMDESTNGWKLSKKKINSTSGTLANTLKPLFDFYDKRSEGFGYVLYNDQPQLHRVSATYGHSKGLQLKYIHAYSFDYEVPKTFHRDLQCVAQRNCDQKPKKPWFRVTHLTSLKGRGFISFSKYRRYGDDLYAGLIVKMLGQNLYVKSWGKMRKPLPSNCSTIIPHHVYNVKDVQPPNMSPFRHTVDHSKWCVTPDGEWACIADMNREVSQMGRGGGAICTNDTAVWKAFFSLVKDHEPCPQPHAQLREL